MSNSLFTPHHGVTFHLTIKIDPANIDKFVEALRPCWTAVTKEPDCLYFEVFHSPDEPGTFRFIEIWGKDNDWFEANQLKKEYYKPYWEVTRTMWLSREVIRFDRLQGWNLVDDKYLEGSTKTKEQLE